MKKILVNTKPGESFPDTGSALNDLGSLVPFHIKTYIPMWT